ncbi:multiple antibiotic resistance protein MarR [Oxobacter pfennigii]|uniref:Multiple antibiotic resistance protein MarR n=1 Tax=Oxobacter pfennigii TaxID=36849 RepID=A0A0P8WJU6_9CLOT|nr:MarR family transcriptional regulator [Oxobacter pfennigii]KPU42439.1 multiple antibiotic resistance protein MarR [Oxobacter pfennigii]
MKKSIGRLLSILHRQSQVYINYALKEYDITSAEYSFLLRLYVQDGITQDELSCYLCIDKAATARAIKSLECKGYVTRDKIDDDKRVNKVYLSDKAKQCKDEVIKKVWQWSDILTEDMNEETVEAVMTALEKMVDKVERRNFKKEKGK